MRDASRVTVVLVAFALGALFAFGSLLAARLERDGFTSASRDGMRAGYVTLLGLGLGASVLTPFGLALVALPGSRRPLLVGLAVTSVLAVVLFVVAIR